MDARNRKPQSKEPRITDVPPDSATENTDKIELIWSLYRSLTPNLKICAIDGLLKHSNFEQLCHIFNSVPIFTKVDFVSKLPLEISIKILQFLDAKSLCRAAQVSKKWNRIADDNQIWKRMCNQHINKKCDSCGWGLPLMQSKRHVREGEDKGSIIDVPHGSIGNPENFPMSPFVSFPPLLPLESVSAELYIRKRPWKHVYAERLIVERNWRGPKFSVRNLTGHSAAVVSLHYDSDHGILVSASDDNSLRAWNTETGECIGVMIGHTMSVKGVQFDNSKIVSCSLDRTIRIWSLGAFNCVRIISGQVSGIQCLHFNDKILASGTIDGSIRVFYLAKGCSFSLMGHTATVNKVRLLPGNSELLSCSDDLTLRLWDISSQSVTRVFQGHSAPVTSIELNNIHGPSNSASGRSFLSASLDRTIRVWDLETGECKHIFTGHQASVNCIDVDTLRMISGSNDESVKVWDVKTGENRFTLDSNGSAIKVCLLSDTLLITGDHLGRIVIRDFLA